MPVATVAPKAATETAVDADGRGMKAALSVLAGGERGEKSPHPPAVAAAVEKR